ncbi:MAG: hypothetical protein PF904_07735 [Kiritimatiellae bacterium]|nr:hypothetical protein [Kiritimatiellia bacterium]
MNDSALDLDEDGFSNLDEYIAGTHPNDSNSVFRRFYKVSVGL